MTHSSPWMRFLSAGALGAISLSKSGIPSRNTVRSSEGRISGKGFLIKVGGFLKEPVSQSSSQRGLPSGGALGEDPSSKFMIFLHNPNPRPPHRESSCLEKLQDKIPYQTNDFLTESVSQRSPQILCPELLAEGMPFWGSSGRGFLIQLDDFLKEC